MADGTLNINGYYYEMFGFTVKSNDFEFGTSDSDSDSSGNDSDCVIISSSEFSSRNPNNCSLIVADSVATIFTSMEISSRFTTADFISTFRQAVQVSGKDSQSLCLMPLGIVCFPSIGLRLLASSREPEWIPLTMSSSELLARENKPESLGEYLSSMSTLSAQQRAALVLKARAQRAEAERAAASADAMSQLVVEESGVKNTKRKNSEESERIPVENPKKRKNTVVDEEEAEIEDEPLKKGRKSNLSASLFTKDFDSFGLVDDGFQKYARTSHLSKLTFEDLKQAAMNHHIQGALLTYYLSNRQELESIDFRNKMESADTSLSALEKEFAAAKSKFEEDLAAVKAEQEQKVKAIVKANYDEVIALKGKVKALEGELDVAIQGKEEASHKVDTLTAKVDALEMDVASQYDDGFRFALDQVKVAFPDVNAVKLGELDSVNQIVDGKIVAYVPQIQTDFKIMMQIRQ
ncbi:hypothetical protein TSUD_406190 [Trifolium subterraneum]|uniref:Uncharacterized protein n=1 Tax=Trifolium subterraneum TaxID=3900 RepID=A0A2Z6NZ70_TRISU|nr:hypothetical protein TSUD_406190 [Trifolium subterraneum]